MKLNNYIYLIICFLLFSCSDKLSESKAESIIKDCLQKNQSNEYLISIPLGTYIWKKGNEESEETLTKLMKIQEEGYIDLSLKKSDGFYKTYEISLTDRAKDLTKEINDLIYGRRQATVVAATYKFDKVKTIVENPSENSAKVTYVLVKKDKTPFNIMSEEKEAFTVKQAVFLKSNNKGWVFCD